MNSLERVLATINHQEPDRVPLGEWGIDHDHVSRIIGKDTFWRNRKATTIALWENRRDEVVESLKEDCVRLVEELDYDIITVEKVPPKSHHCSDTPKQISEGTWEDSKGRIYRYAPSNDSISLMYNPLAPEPRFEIDDSDVENAMKSLEQPEDESVYELIDFIAERYRGKKAILCRDLGFHGEIHGPFHGDYEHSLIITLTSPDEMIKMHDYAVEKNRRLIEHCQKVGVNIMMEGHDFGMNTGTIVRPDSIRQIYMPVLKRINNMVYDHGMIPFFHCCGNVWDIMDDFVDAGFKGYQSIQESATMDNARMKKLYGDKLTMWTGIQCETLCEGTMADVEREVNRNLELLMPGGGFIFGSTNSVQFGAKTDNYLKALEILRKNGVYR